MPPLGEANDAEKAIASICMNDPNAYIAASGELSVDSTMFLNQIHRRIVEVCVDRAMRSQPCELILVAGDLKAEFQHLKFHELSDIATFCNVASALPDFMLAVRRAHIRRKLHEKVVQAEVAAMSVDATNEQIISALQDAVDSLQRVTPTKKQSITQQLMDATHRYENGEDKTTLIGTGFSCLDNVAPIRFKDFLVIGGVPKAGKTMLALNIIANIIKHQNEN